MKPAHEFWKDTFGEYPKTDSDKLAVVMMAEYSRASVGIERSEHLASFLRWVDADFNNDAEGLVKQYISEGH